MAAEPSCEWPRREASHGQAAAFQQEHRAGTLREQTPDSWHSEEKTVKPEFEDQLFEKYPLVFQERNKPLTESLIGSGLVVGDGWFNLIDTLCTALQREYDQARQEYERLELQHAELASNDAPEAHRKLENARALLRYEAERVPPAVQVKEKFGELRFYLRWSDEQHRALTAFARDLSVRTCEVCGCPGHLRQKPWRTLCDRHADSES